MVAFAGLDALSPLADELEVAVGFGWVWPGLGGDGVAEVDALLDGTGDEVAGAQADGEREGEDDTAEEDAEGEFDDRPADLQVIEDHGGGEDENQPFHSER